MSPFSSQLQVSHLATATFLILRPSSTILCPTFSDIVLPIIIAIIAILLLLRLLLLSLPPLLPPLSIPTEGLVSCPILILALLIAVTRLEMLEINPMCAYFFG